MTEYDAAMEALRAASVRAQEVYAEDVRVRGANSLSQGITPELALSWGIVMGAAARAIAAYDAARKVRP